jgi:uncharacterized protein YjbI with pentapeptide repeats
MEEIHRRFIALATLQSTQLQGKRSLTCWRNLQVTAKANQVKLVRTVLIGAAIIVAVLLLVALLVALWLALRWYLNPENTLSIVQRRDLVQGLASAGQALAVFLTGAVGLTGLFFTWRNTRLARESTQETLDLTRRGQITERFTQAINQLGATEGGDKSLEIRLGGIYSLERTAREDRDYHWPIMEVLTTYVRKHAPWKPDKGSSEEEISSPDPDIQAILTVIGRSIHHRDVAYGQVDLHSTDLRRADLRRADLKGANLWDANLQDANLQDANLQDANLQDANLQGAALQRADLKEAYLQGTNLKGAYLQGTQLQEAYLILAKLQGANLWEANLQGTKLQRAKLHRANLQDADLQGADLKGADLRETTDLTDAQLERAFGDQYTQLPDDFRQPASWT